MLKIKVVRFQRRDKDGSEMALAATEDADHFTYELRVPSGCCTSEGSVRWSDCVKLQANLAAEFHKKSQANPPPKLPTKWRSVSKSPRDKGANERLRKRADEVQKYLDDVAKWAFEHDIDVCKSASMSEFCVACFPDPTQDPPWGNMLLTAVATAMAFVVAVLVCNFVFFEGQAMLIGVVVLIMCQLASVNYLAFFFGTFLNLLLDPLMLDVLMRVTKLTDGASGPMSRLLYAPIKWYGNDDTADSLVRSMGKWAVELDKTLPAESRVGKLWKPALAAAVIGRVLLFCREMFIRVRKQYGIQQSCTARRAMSGILENSVSNVFMGALSSMVTLWILCAEPDRYYPTLFICLVVGIVHDMSVENEDSLVSKNTKDFMKTISPNQRQFITWVWQLFCCAFFVGVAVPAMWHFGLRAYKLVHCWKLRSDVTHFDVDNWCMPTRFADKVGNWFGATRGSTEEERINAHTFTRWAAGTVLPPACGFLWKWCIEPFIQRFLPATVHEWIKKHEAEFCRDVALMFGGVSKVMFGFARINIQQARAARAAKTRVFETVAKTAGNTAAAVTGNEAYSKAGDSAVVAAQVGQDTINARVDVDAAATAAVTGDTEQLHAVKRDSKFVQEKTEDVNAALNESVEAFTSSVAGSLKSMLSGENLKKEN